MGNVLDGCSAPRKFDPYAPKFFSEVDLTDEQLEDNWRKSHCEDRQVPHVHKPDAGVKACIRCIQAVELAPEIPVTDRRKPRGKKDEVPKKPIRPVLIITGSNDRKVKIWMMRNGFITPAKDRYRAEIDMGEEWGEIRDLQFDENRLIVCTSKSRIVMYEFKDNLTRPRPFPPSGTIMHTASTWCLQFEDNTLLVGSLDCKISVWNMKTQTLNCFLIGHTAPVLCVQYAKGKAVSGDESGVIRVWDVTNNQTCIHELKGANGPVRTLSFVDSEKSCVVSGDQSGQIMFWDVPNGRMIKAISGVHQHAVYSVKMARRGRRLISASQDNRIVLWRLKPESKPSDYDYEPQPVDIKTAMDGDPEELAQTSLRRIPKSPYDIRIVYCFQPFDDKLVCGCTDGTLLVYNFRVSQLEEKIKHAETDEEKEGGHSSEEDY